MVQREVLCRIDEEAGEPVDGNLVDQKPLGAYLDPATVANWLDNGVEPPIPELTGMKRTLFYSKFRGDKRISEPIQSPANFARRKWPRWSSGITPNQESVSDKSLDSKAATQRWREFGRDTNWGVEELRQMFVVVIDFDDLAQIDEIFFRPTTINVPQNDPGAPMFQSHLLNWTFPYWDLFSPQEIADIRDKTKHVPVKRGTVYHVSALVNFDSFDWAQYPNAEPFAYSE